VSALVVVTKWQIHKITLFVETKKMGKRKMCIKNETNCLKSDNFIYFGRVFFHKKTAPMGAVGN